MGKNNCRGEDRKFIKIKFCKFFNNFSNGCRNKAKAYRFKHGFNSPTCSYGVNCQDMLKNC